MTALLNHTLVFGVPDTVLQQKITKTTIEPHILLNNTDKVIHITDFCKRENIHLHKVDNLWIMFDDISNDIFIISQPKLHILPGAHFLRGNLQESILLFFNTNLKEVLRGYITKELLQLFNDILRIDNLFQDFVILTIDNVWVVYNKHLQTLLFILKDYSGEENFIDYIYKFDGVLIKDNHHLTICEYLLSIINQVLEKSFVVFGVENIETTYHLTKTLLVNVPSVVEDENKIKELERMVSTFQN